MAGNVLWHIRISHYNEKARWGLDRKRVPHVRRAPLPGLHPVVALAVSGHPTLPVLRLNGRTISDSSAILAALDEAVPEPPLYPADPAERARAVALEDWLDEELGPAIRRLAFVHVLEDREAGPAFAAGPGGERQAALMRSGWSLTRPMVQRYYGASGDGARTGEAAMRATLDRLEREVRPSGYLVGDAFSVADLTAAALLGPLTRPPGFPSSGQPVPASLAPLWDELAAHPAARWAREIYVTHR